jgi:hypothetical protein
VTNRLARQNTAVIRPKQLDGANTTLVCLGFCGGGTGPYHPWAEAVAPDVDLALVCYPGRDGRFLEEFATTWDELAEDAARTVVSAVGDRPYVLSDTAWAAGWRSTWRAGWRRRGPRFRTRWSCPRRTLRRADSRRGTCSRRPRTPTRN